MSININGSENLMILVGNLGSDPDFRVFENGDSIANLSVATTRGWKDKASGERRTKKTWHRVVAKNHNAVFARDYLKSGMKVYVRGYINNRKFTGSDEIKRSITETIVESIQPLDKHTSNPKQGGSRDSHSSAQPFETREIIKLPGYEE